MADRADSVSRHPGVKTRTPGVRAVNGDGQRCGCGKESRLRIHYGRADDVRADDAFLCGTCTGRAVELFLAGGTQARFGEAVTEEYRLDGPSEPMFPMPLMDLTLEARADDEEDR
jgi:hypothetical protein